MKEILYSWGMLFLSVLFNVYAVFIIKLRLNELGPIKMEKIGAMVEYFFVLLKSPLVFGAIVLFSIAPFLFAIALSRMEIAIAYPAQVGLNFLFLILLAFIFLGEQMTVYKVTGIIFVLLGIFFLNKAG